MRCLEPRRLYREVEPGVRRCLEWPKDRPLPETAETAVP
jgi:hypothetical protein